jgi:hypothetical protein
LTPASAAAQVSGFSQSNGMAELRDPSRTGKPFSVSDLTMRLPVLPVDPMTRMGAVFICSLRSIDDAPHLRPAFWMNND